MKIETIFLIFMAMGSSILVLILRSVLKDLRNTQEKLSRAQVEIIAKKNELEVLRSVHDKLKESKSKKSPENVEAAPKGDSSSRINRLNRVSNSNKEW